MKKDVVNKIFACWSDANPHPVTELEFTNVYTLLVSVVLSAQSTDVGVNKATKELWKTISTPEQMVELGEVGLKHHIKTIGLYNGKAKNVIALSHILINAFNSEVPRDRVALESLPGVGRKTANVVLNCAWGEPTMAVDTHVQRVSNRIGFVHSSNVLQTEKDLLAIIPCQWMQHAHHWLILHGRYVCKARKPNCFECSISQWCEYSGKELL